MVDAAPIIFLAKLGHLEFLRLNAEEVLVPTEVLKEIAAKQDEANRRGEQAFRRLAKKLRSCALRLDAILDRHGRRRKGSIGASVAGRN